MLWEMIHGGGVKWQKQTNNPRQERSLALYFIFYFYFIRAMYFKNHYKPCGRKRKKRKSFACICSFPLGLKEVYFEFKRIATLFSPSSNCFMQRNPLKKNTLQYLLSLALNWLVERLNPRDQGIAGGWLTIMLEVNNVRWHSVLTLWLWMHFTTRDPAVQGWNAKLLKCISTFC